MAIFEQRLTSSLRLHMVRPKRIFVGSEGLIVEDLPFDLIWGRDALNESGTEIRGVGGRINVSDHVEKYFLLQETDNGGIKKLYFLEEAKKNLDK